MKITDFAKLMETLTELKCNFTTTNTLVGKTLSVYSEVHEMMFEFDFEGNFIRTISNRN